MEEENQQPAYTASFRNLELGIWESDGRWIWSVRDRETGAVMFEGARADREDAMVAAAEAAQADWGSARWRRVGDEE
jgi:hypothetical protein